jgi:hypothetical protein
MVLAATDLPLVWLRKRRKGKQCQHGEGGVPPGNGGMPERATMRMGMAISMGARGGRRARGRVKREESHITRGER